MLMLHTIHPIIEVKQGSLMTCGMGFACAPDAHDGFFLVATEASKECTREGCRSTKRSFAASLSIRKGSPWVSQLLQDALPKHTGIVDPASQAGQFLLLKQPTGFIDC